MDLIKLKLFGACCLCVIIIFLWGVSAGRRESLVDLNSWVACSLMLGVFIPFWRILLPVPENFPFWDPYFWEIVSFILLFLANMVILGTANRRWKKEGGRIVAFSLIIYASFLLLEKALIDHIDRLEMVESNYLGLMMPWLFLFSVSMAVSWFLGDLLGNLTWDRDSSLAIKLKGLLP